MEHSSQCEDLVRRYEGFSATAYRCPANVWTIGVGHTNGVTEKSAPISEEEAMALLHEDLEEAASGVNRLVKVPLTQGQFDALVSFVFNLGAGSLASSTLLKKLNASDYLGAAEEFNRWVHGGGKVLPGLVRRRVEERALFQGTWA